MPIEVKHRAAPGLHLQMAEYAGQGQYRKWLAQYKAQQEQAKTQAFLSAFGAGSQIGLAGRAQKQATAMQGARFGHEAGMQDTRIKAQIQAAKIKAINDQKLAKLRGIHGSMGAAQSSQANRALVDAAREQGLTPIRNFVHQNTSARLGGIPYSLWSPGEKAQAAQMVRNIYQGGTTQEGLSGAYGQQFNQAMQLGRQTDQRRGMFSAGGGGGVGSARAQGAMEFYKKQAGNELGPIYSNQAQDGVKGFQSKVGIGVPIIQAQGIPGTPGYVPAIMGTATGQSGPFFDDESRVYMTAPEAAQGIRSMRESLAMKFRRERDSIAQQRMKSSWQPMHVEGTPVDKKWWKRTDPITGQEQTELRDNIASGQFADEYNSQPGGNLDQMKQEDAGLNEMRAPVVEAYNNFINNELPQKSQGESKEDYLDRLREEGYASLEIAGTVMEMGENGWSKTFPGIPMEGMSPSFGWKYDPHEHKEHWEQNPDGTHTRSYRRMWAVAPTSYNHSKNEDSDRSRNRLHRRMQQQAMDGGPGGEDGRAVSQAWRAYVDKYGHAPDVDLMKKHLNWEAQQVLGKRDEFFGPRGVERGNVVDLREEPFDDSDMRTLGVAMDAQREGFTPDRWNNLGPERKARFRRLFHHLDLRSGYADERGPSERKVLEWATYTGDEWSDPNVGTAQSGVEPPPPPLPRGTGPEGTDPRMLVTEGYGLMGSTREEVSANLPSIAKGWGILIGDKMMYLENPDTEALHLKGAPPPAEAPDPNIQDVNRKSLRVDPLVRDDPPPSAATVLARPGEDQAVSNIKAREARSARDLRALNFIRSEIGKSDSQEDRQDMIRLDAMYKEHGSMSRIQQSKDHREFRTILKRLNERIAIRKQAPSNQDTMDQRSPMP